MKYYVLAATFALACLTAPVYANGDDENGCQGNCPNGGDTFNNSQARATASLRARLSSSARQKQHQAQRQSSYNKNTNVGIQGQSYTGSQEGFGSGNATDVSFYSEYERNAPGISLGQGDPGYDCSMTGGVAGSLPGGALSIQWSDASINCELGLVFKLGRKDPATIDRAYEAYDVLFDRVMEQAGANTDYNRGPSVRDGR